MDGTPVRLLVVEDDASTRELLAEVLSDAGYTVDVAADGAQAVEAARRTLPDVVLLDVNLPVVGSSAFRRELYTMPGGVRTRVVVMSAGINLAAKARQLDAYAYLAKPFDLDLLLETVEAAGRAELKATG